MQSTVYSKSALPSALSNSIFSDRQAQFVGRLGWDLCICASGLEIDEYDSEGTTYLVVHTGEKHVGSCRLRTFKLNSMLMDHFREVFPGANDFLKGQKGRVYELTRFCRSPSATQEEAQQMLRVMAEMLDDFRDEEGLTGFIAVVYPEIARFLGAIGVRFLRLASSQIDGRDAQLICIVHCQRVELTKSMRRHHYSTQPFAQVHRLADRAHAA